MKVIHLVPGTGHFYCGSCLRDQAWIREMRRQGHEIIVYPLYLPLISDVDEKTEGLQVNAMEVNFRSKWQNMPNGLSWFIRKVFANQGVLKLISQFTGRTSARVVGEMTLDALVGKEGKQWGVWNELLNQISKHDGVDVISLSNSLLSGLIPSLKMLFPEAKIVVSLQGEDAFVDAFDIELRARVWQQLQKNAVNADLLIAPSEYYAERMKKKGVVGNIRVLANGVEEYQKKIIKFKEFYRLGFLSRWIEVKGLERVVDAFIKIAADFPNWQLSIAGSTQGLNRTFIDRQYQKIKVAGLEDRVEWLENISAEEKWAWYQQLDLFTMPAAEGEAFGLPVVEALMAGVPVIQPRHSSFIQMIEDTGGGVLYDANDEGGYENGLRLIMHDENQRKLYQQQAQLNTKKLYGVKKMAENFVQLIDVRVQ
jgi:glycosyltransferase involved in cell wall biosynthesis